MDAGYLQKAAANCSGDRIAPLDYGAFKEKFHGLHVSLVRVKPIRSSSRSLHLVGGILKLVSPRYRDLDKKELLIVSFSLCFSDDEREDP